MEAAIGCAIGGLFILLILANFIKGENISPNELQPIEINVVNLGYKYIPKLGVFSDLTNYFIDELGNLYSQNPYTWELNKQKGKDLLICSDNTQDKYGNIINSLRDTKGYKVTVRRKDLVYGRLKLHSPIITVKVLSTTPRHYKVLSHNKVG